MIIHDLFEHATVEIDLKSLQRACLYVLHYVYSTACTVEMSAVSEHHWVRESNGSGIYVVYKL